MLDVNVLVGAYRADAPRHGAVREWLERQANGPSPLAVPSVVLSGFVRVVTHARVFRKPTPIRTALEQLDSLMSGPTVARVDPGARHWDIFRELCERSRAAGNVVPDAYIAAHAIEHGAELATLDRGFGRFAGLRWQDPLDA